MNNSGSDSVDSFFLDNNLRVPVDANRVFEEKGGICLRDAFASNWLEVIEAGIEQAVKGVSTDVDVVKRNNDVRSLLNAGSAAA